MEQNTLNSITPEQAIKLQSVVDDLVNLYNVNRLKIQESEIPSIKDFASGFTYTGRDDFPNIGEHIRSSILSGNTEHLHRWLDEVAVSDGLTVLEQEKSLIEYETMYYPSLKKEKATALVDDELKELPVIFDSKGRDITAEFLKETIERVAEYHKLRQDEDNNPFWIGYEYEDFPSTGIISRLPPSEVEDEIKINTNSNQIEMSQAAFVWLEQYTSKHNDVSMLESQLLKHMRAFPGELRTYKLADSEGYSWSGAADLDQTVEFKKSRLQDFAKKHSLPIELKDREEQQGNNTEQITEIIPLSDVTPEFLAEFAQKTNSFYNSDLDGIPTCRIQYGVNDSDNTIVFGTLGSEKFDDLIEKSNYDLIPGELRVLAGGDWGENLFNNLGQELERECHITLNMATEKVNLDKFDEPTQEGNDQFVEKDFGGEWQEGYAQSDEMDFGSEWQDGYTQPDEMNFGGEWQDSYTQPDEINFGGKWQDGYEQADEIEYGGSWQNGFDEPTEVELSADSDISVDSVSADDMDMSMDIIDLSSTKAIENAPPPIEEQQQSSISEISSDTDSIFYKVDDLGDEHTDDSFSQSVKQHNEIERLERELARANAKISSLQGVIDKTNAVINSDKQLLSNFRAALKTYDRTVGKAEKENIPDQPKKTSPSKQSRK